MTDDEGLADRIRELVAVEVGICEGRMVARGVALARSLPPKNG